MQQNELHAKPQAPLENIAADRSHLQKTIKIAEPNAKVCKCLSGRAEQETAECPHPTPSKYSHN
eukprot:6491349-Amphidinium_carterae.5